MQSLEAVADQLAGTVRDIMTEEVRSARINMSVSEVADLLAEFELRRIVVVDQFKQVAGVISQRDVLRHFVGTTDEPIDCGGASAFAPISDLLEGKKPVTVSPLLPLRNAAFVLAANKIGCLPVVTPDNTLMGILSTTDLIKHLTGHTAQSIETTFRFYSPSASARAKMPAYIRRVNGDLVIPMSAVGNKEQRVDYAVLGYDPPTGRILVKLSGESESDENSIKTKRAEESIVIPASGFVTHFGLNGKASAFDVRIQGEDGYLVLKPRQTN